MAALGFLDLSEGDYAAAHERLARLAELAVTIGVVEPGVLRFLPDEIEALIALGEIEQARPLVAMLAESGRVLDRPWAIATGGRTAALLAAAEGDLDAAEDALTRAFEAHTRLAQPFQLGRTLLVAGTIARRAKSWRVAREYLGRALDLFDSLGTPLWSGKAAAEIARIPGRRRNGDELTEMEKQVARLVAQGLSNKEIAARLFVAVRTVEANITKLHTKLGVRSRTELVSRFPAEPSR